MSGSRVFVEWFIIHLFKLFLVLLFSFNSRKLDSLSMANCATELEWEREEDRISSNFSELIMVDTARVLF
jgi:hypothetical protein